ncbi:hypothetical protein GCM10010402_12350 [Actinomadura luteofluorescens]
MVHFLFAVVVREDVPFWACVPDPAVIVVSEERLTACSCPSEPAVYISPAVTAPHTAPLAAMATTRRLMKPALPLVFPGEKTLEECGSRFSGP